jgi:CelD/BcsL family acetyltransferase involved in cellulose biosynthesis
MSSAATVGTHAPSDVEGSAGLIGALTVRTVTTLDDVEGLRSAWERLQGHSLPADIDYFLAVARNHPQVVRPNVIVVERGQDVIAIVAVYLQRGWIVHRLGPWNPYRPTVSAFATAYRGFLGEQTPEVLTLVFGELLRSVERHEADAIHLRYVEPASPVATMARAAGHGLRRERLVPIRSHWALSLGSTLDETLTRACSATTRESLRRTIRKLERAFEGRFELKVFSDPATAEQMFADLDAVGSRSYQRHGDDVFGPRDLDRALISLGLEKGWYRAYVLYLDDIPAAYWTGYAYGGAFGWRGDTGYDPRFREYGPGTYVLLRLIEALSEDPEITTFDFGGGDVDYKGRLADTRWDEVDIRLFGPGLRNLCVNATGSSVQLLHHALRSTASRFGAHDAPTKLHRHALKRRSLRQNGEPELAETEESGEPVERHPPGDLEPR